MPDDPATESLKRHARDYCRGHPVGALEWAVLRKWCIAPMEADGTIYADEMRLRSDFLREHDADLLSHNLSASSDAPDRVVSEREILDHDLFSKVYDFESVVFWSRPLLHFEIQLIDYRVVASDPLHIDMLIVDSLDTTLDQFEVIVRILEGDPGAQQFAELLLEASRSQWKSLYKGS